ncbi:hypothetical protein MKX01_018737, partial [Papaver californicum]
MDSVCPVKTHVFHSISHHPFFPLSPLRFQVSRFIKFSSSKLRSNKQKRARYEFDIKRNGALSGDADPRFIYRQKALEAAMNDINNSFGKGSVTRLGSAGGTLVETLPSGCLALDFALRGGLPKGRIVEIYGPKSNGKTTLALHAITEVQVLKCHACGCRTCFYPAYSRALGVDIENLIMCQPDHGEMALESTIFFLFFSLHSFLVWKYG